MNIKANFFCHQNEIRLRLAFENSNILQAVIFKLTLKGINY